MENLGISPLGRFKGVGKCHTGSTHAVGRYYLASSKHSNPTLRHGGATSAER